MNIPILRARRAAFTYMTVVITMIVVGLMTAAYLKMVTVQNQFSTRSQTWNRSVPVLEAGIEEAMAHLNRNGGTGFSDTTNVNMSTDGWYGDSSSGWYKVNIIEQDVYIVSIGAWALGTSCPQINSTGYVRQLPAFALNRSFSPFVADSLDSLLTRYNFAKRIVQCDTTNNPVFTKALVAKHGIDLNGNNVRTDSYDSRNLLYNDGLGGYSSLVGRWRDNGDVASNDTLTNVINVGNADIYGRVATGPLGTVAVGSQGGVGTIAWHANPANNGRIQPGYSTDDMNVEFPDVIMPNVAWSAMPAGRTVDGVNYNYVFDAPGDYQLPSGTLGGKILINAPNVRLRVDGGCSLTGNEVIRIATNATLKLYLNCSSASIGGNGVVNPGTPDRCYIFGTPRLTSMSFGGNAQVSAVLYTPNADVSFNGGGNNTTDFCGSAVVNSARLVGHFNFHYDEALGRIGMWRGFTITSWNER